MFYSGLAPYRRRRRTLASLWVCAAFVAAVVLIVGADPALTQTPAARTPEDAPDVHPRTASPLPAITVRARRHKRAAAAPPVGPAPPDGVGPNGGPPVEQTTAGPVSGYRALTSDSATKTRTPIERIPQAVAVIPRAVIDDQRPLTPSEALRNVSGVTGMPTNTFLGFAYKVRGFPADRYVDGLPNYYDGGDNVSLVNTERIEVLKGPAGILYQGGIGPVGGIINTISKLPTPNRFTEAGVMAGGYGLWNPGST